MADYELRYKGEEFGTISCIPITEEQYYSSLRYVEGKTESRFTDYEIRCNKRQFGDPIIVKYLNKKVFDDVVKFLELRNTSKTNSYFIEYSSILDSITIKNYTGGKATIYRNAGKMKFDAMKEKIFGKIDTDVTKPISEKLFKELHEIFPFINSYACSVILDKIDKCMDNKYYLSYAFDTNTYRIHEKKPRRYEGTNGITYQGKGINIVERICGVRTKAYDYVNSRYLSIAPFCMDIPKETYDKILQLINEDNLISNNKQKTNKDMTTKNTTEKKSMMSSMMSKFTSQFVPTEENDVKLSMDGNLVVKQGNEFVGIVGDKNELKAYPEEMCFDVPVYSINKPSKDIKAGDIIKRKNSYYKVTTVKDNGVLSLLSFSGNYTSSKEIKDAVLNQSFEKVLINYFNQDNNSGFNPMMFMFMKDSNVDMEALMMMSMMSQNDNSNFNFGNMFGSNSGMNPMMMMLMMKDKGDSSIKDMMMFSMMGNMFNNQKTNENTI